MSFEFFYKGKDYFPNIKTFTFLFVIINLIFIIQLFCFVKEGRVI